MIQEKLKLNELLEGLTITVRPNLNCIGESTIHKGRLGVKLASVETLTFLCTSTVIRDGGLKKAIDGTKTVHAGLIGEVCDFVQVNPWSKRVVYNPHKGQRQFYIVEFDGSLTPYNGGGKVTAIGWKYYLVG